jgi:hypothetical protein
LRPGQGAAAAGAWVKGRCAVVPRLPSLLLTFVTHNSEQELTWLAGENAMVPCLSGCARMGGAKPEPPGSSARIR